VVVARLVAKGSLQEIREARITTETLRGHAARAKLGKEAQDTCAVARLRLERRLGEVLPPYLKKGAPKKVGSDDHSTLRELGISKDLSARSQRIAAIPERLFEGYFRDARAAGWDITAEGPKGLLDRAEDSGISDIARQRVILPLLTARASINTTNA
jgi:hypothetical protein